MADYYIHAVHQEKDVIKTVKTCTSYTIYGPGETKEKTRKTVVEDINPGNKSIFTIYKGNSGYWKLGENVIIEIIDGEKYIKTKANGKKCDNLDNIEQY